MNRAALFAISLLLARGVTADCWLVQPESSTLHFTGTQAGAPVRGEFQRFAGELYLASENPRRGYINAQVETSSLETQLPELNEILRGPEFFDSERWPQASFQSRSIEPLDDRRDRATGTLRIRDIERTVDITFRFQPEDGNASLRGTKTFQRLDYDLGTGEWRNTDWVGNDVEVRADMSLKRAADEECTVPE